MKLKRAKESYTAVSLENRLARIAIASSLILNCFFGWALVSKPETIVLLPPYVSEEMRFTEGRANSAYYENWAWSTAMLIGNLDPSNTKFVQHNLQHLATPALFTRIEQKIDGEMEGIIKDKAVITFTPREVIYDPEIDKFFVPGIQRIGGPGTKTLEAKDVTYEMEFTSEWNRIYLSDLRVYNGPPLTADIRRERVEQMNAAAAQEGGDG